MTRHAWLIGAALAIGAGVVVACGDDSSSDTTGDESAVRHAVAEALTAGINFADGTVRLQPLPDTTNDDLLIQQEQGAVTLDPGGDTLLPFTIDNPDEADDPVVAVLLSFEDDAEEHVEVELDMADAGSDVEIPLSVEDNICDNLCATTFNLRLLQKLKLDSGGIGKVARRLITLDCSKAGKQSLCEDSSGDGDGDGDGDTADSGAAGDGDGDTAGTGGGTGSQSNASQFNNWTTMVNQALCTCAGTPGVHCATDWLSAAEQTCAVTAIMTDASSANTSALISGLRNVATITAACDPTMVFDLALPKEANRELPQSLVECAPDVLGGAASDGGTATP